MAKSNKKPGKDQKEPGLAGSSILPGPSTGAGTMTFAGSGFHPPTAGMPSPTHAQADAHANANANTQDDGQPAGMLNGKSEQGKSEKQTENGKQQREVESAGNVAPVPITVAIPLEISGVERSDLHESIGVQYVTLPVEGQDGAEAESSVAEHAQEELPQGLPAAKAGAEKSPVAVPGGLVIPMAIAASSFEPGMGIAPRNLLGGGGTGAGHAATPQALRQDWRWETARPARMAEAGSSSTEKPRGNADGQPLLFEVAWEVCWQLGGIYTVMRSKAASMTKAWGDRYHLIGPYNADTASVEFEEAQPEGAVAAAIESLRKMGVEVHYGHWLITGRPRVILINFLHSFGRLGEFKYYLAKDHNISYPDQDWEVNNVVVFGSLVSLFFQELVKAPGVHLPVLAHFHEWMSGLGLMRIRFLNLPIATVFTTHATILGRYLATDNPDFYAKLDWINPDHAAGHYNIYARYCIERGAAHCAEVFTTVSDVTALEAEKLLLRRPDVITPNGLNIKKFAALHEFQNLHKEYKQVIHNFVAAHFFPSYTFDLDKTIYLFTSGRYEFTNKGINLFIESLARLNHWLRAGNIPVTVVAFIITRAATKSINVDVLKSQAMFDELKLSCESIADDMGKSLLETVSQGRLPERGELLTEEAIVRLKRNLHAWRTWKEPHIITHDLMDDAHDPVLQQLRACRLFNGRHDPVKVVFHPDFLSATSPLLGLDYDQFVRGCHMGVFPSYYEPWGYTPMECVASGLPAVTSDLAGFGSYVLKNIQDPTTNGLFVIGRRYAHFDQSAHQLTEVLFNFALKDRRGRIELRNKVERLSEYFDWGNLITHYAHAHRLALSRKAGVEAAG